MDDPKELRGKYCSDITPEDFGSKATVAGWLQDVRNLGGIAFLQLRDRTGVLQVTAIKKEMGAERFRELVELPRESVLSVTGSVQENSQAKAGFEVLPEEWEVLSRAEVPLPLGVVDKVGADLDTRLDNRFIDLRKPEVSAIFRLRAILTEGLRRSLIDQGFVEVSTPKIVSAGAEGGATLFKLDYFGKPAYLAQSPQLYKQHLMATGLDRVFEVAPAFRAEPSDTIRHLAEFTSLDVEQAFVSSSEDVMGTVEQMTVDGVRYLIEEGSEMLDSLLERVEVPPQPFRRIPYEECMEMLADSGVKVSEDAEMGTEHEKALGDLVHQRWGEEYYFITDFPTRHKIGTFYAHRHEDRPHLTGYFDLGVRGQEVASGGKREHRMDVLTKQIEEAGLVTEDFEFYLKAFRYGMPPHGGYGYGVERLLQKVLGLPNIRETVLYPRDRQRLVP
ncbi:MAG: aspartate--tRNA(Asn) ligase [Thermoplasmata archaeon]|nr:aspartate--tRNA(Asn) ligase [Thermoplasmata archaeon]